MDNLEYIKSIDIGNDGIEDSQFNSFKNKLTKELDFYDAKFENGTIDKDKLNDIKSDLKELLEDFEVGKQDINKEYDEFKNETLIETSLKLSEFKDVISWQNETYELFGIDKFTYKNSTKNRFIKGIVDVLILDNKEVFELIQKDGIKKFLGDLWNALTSLETWKEIAESLDESLWDLFSGDAYEKGKAAAEFGLIGTGAFAAAKGIQKATGIIYDKAKKTEKNLVFEHNRIDKTLEPVGKNINPDLVSPEFVKEINRKIDNGEVLNDTEIQILESKIIKNNPTIGIVEKLGNSDKVESMIFTGIKSINDKYSQAFTDRVINRFKKDILSQNKEYESIWNDYKNFVVKGENIEFSDDFLNKKLIEIFNDEKSKLSVAEAREVNKRSYIKEDLGVVSETKVITGRTNEDTMLELAEIRGNLEAKANVGEILDKSELINKLDNIKNKYSGDYKQEILDERGRTKYTIENGVITKEFTIGETGKKGVDKFMIFDSDGNLTKEMISLVRKDKIDKNLEIYKDVKQIIKSSIVHGEFIGPYVLKNGKIIDENILKAKNKIFEKLKSGETLDKNETLFIKELSEKTYKGALDKDTFVNKIDSPGEIFFIDIAGMGDINILDFLDKIKKENSGIISKKELKLNSGGYMTEKFQSLLKGIEEDFSKIYPGKEINYYIGGDEIGIFVDGAKVESKKAIKIIKKHLDKNNLEGRTTRNIVTNDNLKSGGEKIFEGVDKLTTFSKTIESRITESISKIKIENPGNIDALNMLNRIKDFDIIEKNGVKYINFNSIELVNGRKTFKLEEIINMETNKLIPYPDSPFITFLEKNNLNR